MRIITLLILFTSLLLAHQPEYYFKIKDNTGAYYIIEAIANHEPVYYYKDGQWINKIEESTPTEQYFADSLWSPTPRGFDLQGSTNYDENDWDDLGRDLYKIKISRSESGDIGSYEEFFTFYLDTRHCQLDIMDIEFKFEVEYGNLVSAIHSYVDLVTNEKLYDTLNENEVILLWENRLLNFDWDCFTENVEFTNSFSGSVNYNIITTIEDTTEGVPYDYEYQPANIAYEDYNIGVETVMGDGDQFSVTDSANLWLKATYGFYTNNEPKLYNDVLYRIRDWANSNDYGNYANVKIIDDEVKSNFSPVESLTVTNYLEGGSGGSYSVTWQAANKTDTLNSGEVYFAFDNIKTEDQYNINVGQTIQSQYGTDWYFQYWDDGSTNPTITDVAVTAPTTRKQPITKAICVRMRLMRLPTTTSAKLYAQQMEYCILFTRVWERYGIPKVRKERNAG